MQGLPPLLDLVTSVLVVFEGVNGYAGDGDITKTENIEAFRDYVLECTGDLGVHFVMADGVSSLCLVVVFMCRKVRSTCS